MSLNLFQILSLLVITFILARCVMRFARSGASRGWLAMEALIWILAGTFILRPEWTVAIAHWLGIGRGTDLVLYIVAITFLASIAYFYNRILKLEAEITKVVRHLAIRDAAQQNMNKATGVSGGEPRT